MNIVKCEIVHIRFSNVNFSSQIQNVDFASKTICKDFGIEISNELPSQHAALK